MKTLKKLSIIFASMFMLAAFAGCDDGECESDESHVESNAESNTESNTESNNKGRISFDRLFFGCEYKIELAENLKTEYNSLNIKSISCKLSSKYDFKGSRAFAMTSAELKESSQCDVSDSLHLNENDVFKIQKQDVKIYYGLYELSNDDKEIQGVILTEETRTPAQFSQSGKLNNTTYNYDTSNAIYEFKGHLTTTTLHAFQDIGTTSEKSIIYPGTITITEITPRS
ncbi:hypothetical protein [uncultured Treponema sp.]|uniref:hypothetical protein n=1 Tax=uncultured Treponema sp. TaxID=162155 RepID=UPI002585914E|nr:hypothetical protein [uncultured Treponema sp.]